MTTRARDFKFAGTPVQRLQLAMVALTQKSFSAQYDWFSRGGSHIIHARNTASELYKSDQLAEKGRVQKGTNLIGWLKRKVQNCPAI